MHIKIKIFNFKRAKAVNWTNNASKVSDNLLHYTLESN